MVSGSAAYVLPRFDNKIYVMIEEGEHFGHVDFALAQNMQGFDISVGARYNRRKDMIRRFTVQAINNCETFVLTIDNLEKMKIEFPDLFD